MSVNEARAKFEAAKKAVASCQSSITELQRKSDSLQESLPGLSREIETAEKAKTAALDNFALYSNKESESELKRARAGYESAVRQRAEANELVEATNRTLKKMETEFVRLNNAREPAKRQVWKSVFDEIQASIPHEVFDKVRMLIVCGSQMGMTQQFVLDSLFKNPCPKDFQAVRNELCAKYNLD